MSPDEAALAAYDAAEMLAYAGLTGDEALTAQAYALMDEAAVGDKAAPSAADRSDLVDADPVSAAALGWLSYPELQRIVSANLDRYLYPDEASAVRLHPEALRTVVRARTDGQAFADLEARRGDYELAARGSSADARAVWSMLKSRGVVRDEPPTSDRP
jgi:hypothetical protein